MQILMGFLEAPLTKNGQQVWATLDPVQRTEIVMTLARLIAKSVGPSENLDEETHDE